MYVMYVCKYVYRYMYICTYVCMHVNTYVLLFHRLKHLLGYSKSDLEDRLPFDLHHHDDTEPCRRAHHSCKHFYDIKIIIFCNLFNDCIVHLIT